MKYVARLVTQRQLERPIQRFCPNLEDVETMGVQMLKAGDVGDTVDVFKLSEVPVCSLVLAAHGKVEKIDPFTNERTCLE